MDKIEKIKKWVQKQMELYWEKLPDADDEHPTEMQLRDLGQYMAYESMESFLDTLSEELDKSLEEAIMEYYGNIPDDKDKVDAARHFAEWGAEHLRDSTKIIDKSLEEAALSYVKNKYNFSSELVYNNIGTDDFKAGAEWQASQMPMPEDTVLFNKGVAEGRRLEREDMLGDEISCEIDWYDGPILNYPIDQLCEVLSKMDIDVGDKVRIIVLKEEE